MRNDNLNGKEKEKKKSVISHIKQTHSLESEMTKLDSPMPEHL